MAISRIAGENFHYDGGKIKFFDAEGFRTDKGWCVNWTELGDIPVEVERSSSLLSDIERCVEEDFKKGYRNNIKMLLVPPRNAAVLFLLNKIRTEHLKKAQEHDGVIDIPSILIYDRIYVTVRVTPGLEYGCATATEDGEII